MDVVEIEEGLWRWTAFHEEWNEDVGCVYVDTEDGAVLIDPLVPKDATAKFWKALDRDVKRQKGRVHVLITVFWHARSAAEMRERYDARICIAIGLLTLAQYGGLWAYAAATYDLTEPAWVAAAGPYSRVDLATRLILLAVATILAVTIVRRAQRLLYLASRDRLTELVRRLTQHLNRQPPQLARLANLIQKRRLAHDRGGSLAGFRPCG